MVIMSVYDVASPSVTVTDGSPLSLNVQFQKVIMKAVHCQ